MRKFISISASRGYGKSQRANEMIALQDACLNSFGDPAPVGAHSWQSASYVFENYDAWVENESIDSTRFSKNDMLAAVLLHDVGHILANHFIATLNADNPIKNSEKELKFAVGEFDVNANFTVDDMGIDDLHEVFGYLMLEGYVSDTVRELVLSHVLPKTIQQDGSYSRASNLSAEMQNPNYSYDLNTGLYSLKVSDFKFEFSKAHQDAAILIRKADEEGKDPSVEVGKERKEEIKRALFEVMGDVSEMFELDGLLDRVKTNNSEFCGFFERKLDLLA